MIVRKTKKEENQRINELFAIAFELSAEDGPAVHEGPKIHHWAAFQDDNQEMMSSFTISDFNINFDGSSCKMGGIGGVSTLPQYRRMGGIRGCFEKALPDMFEENYDFSYLYPFSTAYYRKFGYECCVQKMEVSIDLGLLKIPLIKGQLYLCEAAHPMKEEIKELDALWEAKFNMMVCHDDEDYKWTEKFIPAKNLEFTYVYVDENHKAKAYTSFTKVDEPDGRNLRCSRFCFRDQEGFAGLMSLFKSLSSDHRYVKFSLPAKENMEYLFPEWAMGAAMWCVRNAGMVRVINVENVLKKASYQGSDTVTLEIKDVLISKNTAVYTISFEAGKLVSVEKSSENPDIILDINIFSALILGVCSLNEAEQWMPGVKIFKNKEALSKVFYKKPLMIADYF